MIVIKTIFLFPLSLVFGTLVAFKNFIYNFKLLKPKKLARPVLSIGNISVGGSGKTSVLLALAPSLKGVSVLTRGYGSLASKTQNNTIEVTSYNDSNYFGDEPSLIKKKLNQVSIFIDANRFRSGQFAMNQDNKIEVFVLDDGFQHRKLYRDIDIVVFDVSTYFQSYGLMPFGRFRERLGSLARADYILMTKYEFLNEAKIQELTLKLKRYCPQVYRVQSLISEIKDESNHALSSKNIILVSALGNPVFFEESIAFFDKSLNIISHKKFKDHHHFSNSEIESLINLAKEKNAELVCSEKDFIKIKNSTFYIAFQKIILPELFIKKIKVNLDSLKVGF